MEKERTGKSAHDDPGDDKTAEEEAGKVEEPEDGGERIEEFPLETLKSDHLVRWFIVTLSAKAWESLGLVANPLTQEIQVDLKQARIAIDSIGALLPVIEGELEDDEASRLKALLSDLRVNYVDKSKEHE